MPNIFRITLSGFLIYLPTLAFMPHSLYLLAILYSLLRYINKTPNPLKPSIYNTASIDFGIVFLIVALSGINFLFGKGMEQFLMGNIPGFILLPFTILIALDLRKSDLRMILGLILIECLTVFFEYAMGINTIFPSLSRYHAINESELLYYNKALGLSYNSSIVAAKFFIGFLLLEVVRIKAPIKLLFQIILLTAIFLTFNRTVFVAVGLLIALKYLHTFVLNHLTLIRWNFLVTGIFIGVVVLLAFGLIYWNEIVAQLTRRTGSIELSGRDRIWQHYFEFIREHFWFGNNSFKYYFGAYHGHNSFIQLVATNGILISLLYVYMILRNINLSNVVFVSAIMVYCLFQYGIFWGISLMDIVFFYFLLTIKDKQPVSEQS